MENSLKKVFIENALNLISQVDYPGVQKAYQGLTQVRLDAGLAEEFLSNGYIKTALAILKTFVGNYKIKQALKLLQEAAEEG